MNDEYEKIYGISTERRATFNMCGGCAEWWNYVVIFTNGKDNIYREDSTGLHLVSGDLIYDSENEEVKLIFDIKNYELGEDEMIIDEDFFGFDSC